MAVSWWRKPEYPEKSLHYIDWTISIKELMFNAKSAIFQLYNDENKLLFNEYDDDCHFVLDQYADDLVRFMVLNATFNNISVISWRSVLLVEEIRVPRENH